MYRFKDERFARYDGVLKKLIELAPLIDTGAATADRIAEIAPLIVHHALFGDRTIESAKYAANYKAFAQLLRDYHTTGKYVFTNNLLRVIADVGAPDVGAPDVGAPDVGAPDVGAPDVGAGAGLRIDASATRRIFDNASVLKKTIEPNQWQTVEDSAYIQRSSSEGGEILRCMLHDLVHHPPPVLEPSKEPVVVDLELLELYTHEMASLKTKYIEGVIDCKLSKNKGSSSWDVPDSLVAMGYHAMSTLIRDMRRTETSVFRVPGRVRDRMDASAWILYFARVLFPKLEKQAHMSERRYKTGDIHVYVRVSREGVVRYENDKSLTTSDGDSYTLRDGRVFLPHVSHDTMLAYVGPVVHMSKSYARLALLHGASQDIAAMFQRFRELYPRSNTKEVGSTLGVRVFTTDMNEFGVVGGRVVTVMIPEVIPSEAPDAERDAFLDRLHGGEFHLLNDADADTYLDPDFALPPVRDPYVVLLNTGNRAEALLKRIHLQPDDHDHNGLVVTHEERDFRITVKTDITKRTVEFVVSANTTNPRIPVSIPPKPENVAAVHAALMDENGPCVLWLYEQACVKHRIANLAPQGVCGSKMHPIVRLLLARESIMRAVHEDREDPVDSEYEHAYFRSKELNKMNRALARFVKHRSTDDDASSIIETVRGAVGTRNWSAAHVVLLAENSTYATSGLCDI